MGNCCATNNQDIDAYMKSKQISNNHNIEYHPNPIKYEKNNYELAKQDRNLQDQNLFMPQGDLDDYVAKQQRKRNGSQMVGYGEEAEGGERSMVREEIDEETLREMIANSNKLAANNLMMEGENGTYYRKNGAENMHFKSKVKEVTEEYDIDDEGETGTGGKPRVREEIKIPPKYDEIDLNDPDDEVLFQGELLKHKEGYVGAFISRWVQVTSKAFKIYTNRSKAITAWNKPLLAIPVEAIKSVERCEIDLHLTEKD